MAARYEVHPGRFKPGKRVWWRAPSVVLGNGKNQKSRSDAALIARLYQEIGQLKAERNFLAERSGA